MAEITEQAYFTASMSGSVEVYMGWDNRPVELDQDTPGERDLYHALNDNPQYIRRGRNGISRLISLKTKEGVNELLWWLDAKSDPVVFGDADEEIKAWTRLCRKLAEKIRRECPQ